MTTKPKPQVPIDVEHNISPYLAQLIDDYQAASEEDRLAFKQVLKAKQVADALPDRVPLVEKDHIYLINFEPARHLRVTPRMSGFRCPVYANEWRFARCFRFVWSEIPVPDRQRLTDHWRKNNPSGVVERYPLIYLRSDAAMLRYDGWCSYLGCKLEFAARVTISAGAYLEYIIAHELAHCHRHATGESQALHETHWEPISEAKAQQGWAVRDRRWRREEERETNGLAARWGFQRPRRRPRRHWE